ncbi:MAG: flagellar export chaperone FliS [Candidatus Omnitrophica bacterium]|nr:flagellar export chaperone FliS [Candidatus Omnitrophota bacterium]MCA9414624.1 flagellar export chaperone FliS [Candidatus Omnitrophota bacterium]MCA9431571.1 flagellar export chaperone FliS [Candidatus Omnitrophota bacterium]MCA9440275.1 flagellar export chaperone FliS [Candidatus Omnitrophota bacterium]MCA9446453.1 flagellar export chaperone FliS [Candidatus Omnitrophota bacterium]
MNAMNYQATKNYQKIQVEAARPERLVLMLFDGAVKKLGLAETAHREDRLEEFHSHVVRVQKIISELLGALDASKGGDLAENLERLYDYMLRQLSLALVRRNLEQVEEVKRLLTELREGWQGVVDQNASEENQSTAEEEESQPSQETRSPLVTSPYAASRPAVSTLNISG